MSSPPKSYIFTSTLVAGIAMATRMNTGTMVHASSSLVLSWKFAGSWPTDFRCAIIE